MSKKRNKIPSLTEKRLLQECRGQCPFCAESDAATFEFHHIDEDPTNNSIENLLIVCASCHTRITRGIISIATIIAKKRDLQRQPQNPSKTPTSVNVNIHGSSFMGDIAQNITKITTKQAPRIAHPPGSVGANLAMKAYVDYLIDKYFTYRKADGSYGRHTPFSHSVIHQNIRRNLGAKTFFLPEDRFFALVDYLTITIDRTIQGKRNVSRGIPNYHSFEEHCEKHGFRQQVLKPYPTR